MIQMLATKKERAKQWRKDNPDKMRAMGLRRRRLRKRYGISVVTYEKLLLESGGRCSLCLKGFGEAAPCVDHCHSNGHVRGLLCRCCNVGLGMFQDDPGALRRAASYLEGAPAVHAGSLPEPAGRAGRPRGPGKPTGRAPLSEEFVRCWNSGEFENQQALAAHFGVSDSTIARWKQKLAASIR